MEVFNKPLYEDIMNTGIMLSVLVFKSPEPGNFSLLLTAVRFSELQ